MFAPADIIFSARRLLQPDLLSPSTARADRYRKRAIYMDEGVGEYWIVDAGQRLIERWRPGDSEPQVITDELVWSPREGVARFTLDVVAYFDEVEAYPLR